jgi:BirA family transcriptional regulator, biotin operon repressor / biotin---[acetyl-CoA-carboxylase] ligase
MHAAVCASTNSLAAQSLDRMALSDGTVVITDHQYQGRGQHGHVWHSEPHKNLTFSVILYPSFLATQQSFALNVITTLALQHVLESYIPSGLRIKWPNDLYYQDKKLGGVLIENVVQQYRIKTSIIGIGLNVNQACFTLPTATSLSLVCRRPFSLQQLLTQLSERLEINYLQLQTQATDLLQVAYLKNMYWKDEIHVFQDANHTFQGKIRGIDAVGKLMIEQADGTSKHYKTQEVTFIA